MGYSANGEFCGEYELNPLTLYTARKNQNFTDVIKTWPAHTFIPEVLPLTCNELYPDGSNVELPECYPPPEEPEPETPVEYPPEEETP